MQIKTRYRYLGRNQHGIMIWEPVDPRRSPQIVTASWDAFWATAR